MGYSFKQNTLSKPEEQIMTMEEIRCIEYRDYIAYSIADAKSNSEENEALQDYKVEELTTLTMVRCYELVHKFM